MMQLLVIISLLFTLVIAKTNTDKKIASTSSKIVKFSKNYTQLNRKMAQNAKNILHQRREIEKQQKYLKELKFKLSTKEENYKNNKIKLETLVQNNETLKNNQAEIEEELVFVIAQSVTLSVILEADYAVNETSLMEFEVLHHMLQDSKEKAKLLNEKYYANSKDITGLNKEAESLKKSINTIDTKRKELTSKQANNKKSLKNLQRDQATYKRKLKGILQKQDHLKQTLSKLNIIKVDEVKKAEEDRLRKLAFKKKKASDTDVVLNNENLPKVKKHGSSYQSIKTKKYRGPKTIAPLAEYTISKKYGTYTDPIYGIKIFNESISLKPKKANAKVKTVFNGKVIYADKTAVLNNIVIVEHKNGLHTIYANLSKISRNIKKGQKIKKGYSIGRVDDELIFEVTQKSYHINPIRLFK